jgi:hypothetical protein
MDMTKLQPNNELSSTSTGASKIPPSLGEKIQEILREEEVSPVADILTDLSKNLSSADTSLLQVLQFASDENFDTHV